MIELRPVGVTRLNRNPPNRWALSLPWVAQNSALFVSGQLPSETDAPLVGPLPLGELRVYHCS